MSATKTQTLYELGEDRRVLDEWLDEHEGELIPDLEVLLAENAEAWGKKVERVALYICDLESTATACKAEAATLTDRARARTNRADSLREYLRLQVAQRELTKVEGTLKTVARQKNSAPSVKCVNPEAVYVAESVQRGDVQLRPVVTRVETVTFELDRAEAVRRFKANEPIPDGVEVVYGEHLRIR